jgi:hypothetical protein
MNLFIGPARGLSPVLSGSAPGRRYLASLVTSLERMEANLAGCQHVVHKRQPLFHQRRTCMSSSPSQNTSRAYTSTLHLQKQPTLSSSTCLWRPSIRSGKGRGRLLHAFAVPQVASPGAAPISASIQTDQSRYSIADEIGQRSHGSCLSKLSLGPGEVHIWWLFPDDVRHPTTLKSPCRSSSTCIPQSLWPACQAAHAGQSRSLPLGNIQTVR